ncbi:Ktr system potassium uptake protein B [Mycobacteroides abscessus subsp. abscessus]|nr:TrkH family potassium uptake protein [Brevibacterium casei]NJE67839.1 TrkH family potassium uptake protein [Brevibacterium sp. LS14]SIG61690.1 Ktr system potassium uptake protein B [Mycobacteroides abscessus subsp. abscessus]MBY3577832.1 TrkH family potassium uptake protein [Brevibacterium casei]QPR39106.1 TrkH family potassium uptake protein [Brevibacterium casei]
MQSTHRNAIVRVVLGYLTALVVGTGLLMTPAATVAPGGISLLSGLFTATSALSVTGLVVLDTGQDFTFFGQIVILSLIQVGGLGVLLLTTLLALVVAGRAGLRLRQSVASETKSSGIGGIKPMVLRIIALTLTTEAIVAVLLYLRFRFFYGDPVGEAVWSAIFHSISAFNNAGFGLNADSLMAYVADPFVTGPIALAVILGGLGYPVLIELFRKYRFPLTWNMTTRAVVVVTPILLLTGTVFIAAIEWTNPATLGALDWWGKIQAASFQSTITRTAGFNSIDISQMHPASWFGMDILMFIGGGPAGTAGGVKITTFVVLAAMTWTEVSGGRAVNLFGRRVSRSVHRQATTVIVLALGLIVVSTMAIMLNAPDLRFDRILFEVVSAFGTVGLSTGITAQLPAFSQAVLIVTMIFGRLGPVTVASALALRSRPIRYELPKERPLIG